MANPGVLPPESRQATCATWSLIVTPSSTPDTAHTKASTRASAACAVQCARPLLEKITDLVQQVIDGIEHLASPNATSTNDAPHATDELVRIDVQVAPITLVMRNTVTDIADDRATLRTPATHHEERYDV